MHILNGQLIINLDRHSAEKAGEIDGTLTKAGYEIGPIDCMIAGIAIIKNDKLITRNVKDFMKVKDLKVESY